MSNRNPTCGCGEEGICNDASLECHPCCRCVPRRLCAVLPSAESVLMPHAGDGEYTGTISCSEETMILRVFLHHEDGTCYWRVISEEFYIDEWFEIDGTEGRTCEKPILEIASPFLECPGLITIQKQSALLLPTVLDENDCPQPFCDGCQCIPWTLCFRYTAPSNVLPVVSSAITSEVEAIFDPESGKWEAVLLMESDPYNGTRYITVEVFIEECDPYVEGAVIFRMVTNSEIFGATEDYVSVACDCILDFSAIIDLDNIDRFVSISAKSCEDCQEYVRCGNCENEPPPCTLHGAVTESAPYCECYGPEEFELVCGPPEGSPVVHWYFWQAEVFVDESCGLSWIFDFSCNDESLSPESQAAIKGGFSLGFTDGEATGGGYFLVEWSCNPLFAVFRLNEETISTPAGDCWPREITITE